MPPQDDETHDSANDSLPQRYTDDGGAPSQDQQQKQQETLIVRETDLDILHEIIALATTTAGSQQSFRHIWRAYDAVLAARKIDPALDSVYFRFILEMQGAPGEDLKEKFIYMLDVSTFFSHVGWGVLRVRSRNLALVSTSPATPTSALSRVRPRPNTTGRDMKR
jgi:hypothetical protein